MSSDFPRTVLLYVSAFPASVNRNVIAAAITNRFSSLKVTAVPFVANIARVFCADAAVKQLILRNESIFIGDIPCRVRGGGPRPQNVFVCNFPFEANNDLLARALNKFGEVKDGFNCCWLHLSGVADGVRVVSMVRNQAIPWNLDVEGFRVKVSHYGQAVECDICEPLAHVARDCPLKGKCLWCHQPGDLARECVNPRADSIDIPDDRALIRHQSLLLLWRLNLHPRLTLIIILPIPRLVFHLLCRLIRLMSILLWRRMVRLLVFPVETIISRVHLTLILSLISIKLVLIKNIMFKKVVLILSKVPGILNKVLMWNKVGVMIKIRNLVLLNKTLLL